MQFEWDEQKEEQNQWKHGISFDLAVLVFADENCLVSRDRIDDETGEQRWHAIGRVQAEVGFCLLLVVVHVYRNISMEKKSSVLSQPEKLKWVTLEDIKRKKRTKEELQTIRRLAAKQAAGDDSDINYDDIPRLTEEQLSKMFRFRDRNKIPVSVRLDPRVLDWLKSKGEGHLTRINDILMNLMEAEQRARRP